MLPSWEPHGVGICRQNPATAILGSSLVPNLVANLIANLVANLAASLVAIRLARTTTPWPTGENGCGQRELLVLLICECCY